MWMRKQGVEEGGGYRGGSRVWTRREDIEEEEDEVDCVDAFAATVDTAYSIPRSPISSILWNRIVYSIMHVI